MTDLPKLGLMDRLQRQHNERQKQEIPAPPTQPASIDQSPEDPGDPAPRVAASVHLPDYLHTQLKHECVARSCTISFLIIEALKAANYGVSDADLIPDKRRKN